MEMRRERLGFPKYLAQGLDFPTNRGEVQLRHHSSMVWGSAR